MLLDEQAKSEASIDESRPCPAIGARADLVDQDGGLPIGERRSVSRVIGQRGLSVVGDWLHFGCGRNQLTVFVQQRKADIDVVRQHQWDRRVAEIVESVLDEK